jgi:hypothetical protein
MLIRSSYSASHVFALAIRLRTRSRRRVGTAACAGATSTPEKDGAASSAETGGTGRAGGGSEAAAAPEASSASDTPAVAVYRAFNPSAGDHLQGTANGEGAPAWNPEGVGFHIFADSAPDHAPLVRCRLSGTVSHFLTNDFGCEGQTVEGLLGLVETGREAVSHPSSAASHSPAATTSPRSTLASA